EDHTLRNFLAFAAGVGVGIGAGKLLAPSSGEELSNNITDKVQEITNRVSSRDAEYSTGTEGGIYARVVVIAPLTIALCTHVAPRDFHATWQMISALSFRNAD